MKKVAHYYNYDIMKKINENKQMTDVWHLPAIAKWEKTCGKHPTQKPLSLLTRILLASTKAGEWVMDPFSGSGTTGIAANLLGRKYLGIEQEQRFNSMAMARKKEIENITVSENYRKKIKDLASLTAEESFFAREVCEGLGYALPF